MGSKLTSPPIPKRYCLRNFFTLKDRMPSSPHQCSVGAYVGGDERVTSFLQKTPATTDVGGEAASLPPPRRRHLGIFSQISVMM